MTLQSTEGFLFEPKIQSYFTNASEIQLSEFIHAVNIMAKCQGLSKLQRNNSPVTHSDID